MTCQKCRTAFEDETDLRVTVINSVDDSECYCEQFNASEHSLSLISDDEHVYLVIRDPDMLNDDGSLSRIAVEQSRRKGMSVQRCGSSDDEMIGCISNLHEMWQARPKKKKAIGVIRVKVSVLKSIQNGFRFVCLYDTGLIDKPFHAEIMISNEMDRKIKSGASKTIRSVNHKRFCKELSDLMGKEFIDFSEFRDGLLIGHLK